MDHANIMPISCQYVRYRGRRRGKMKTLTNSAQRASERCRRLIDTYKTYQHLSLYK